MPKACELNKGDIVSINNTPCALEELKVSTPSARGAASVYHLRFRNLVTKAKIDHNVKGEEMYPPIDFDKRPVQYLYKDKDEYTFMDTEDYSQFVLLHADIEDQVSFLKEDMEGITALLSEGKVLAIELPAVVELLVVTCDPSMRSASATARTKNATLETGLELQVPDYLESNVVIRVDTRTGKFVSRA